MFSVSCGGGALALAKAESAKNKGEAVEDVTEEVAESTIKHLAVLDEVLEKVPEQAKPSIEKAMEARSFLKIDSCEDGCLNPNELLGLIGSVGIQNLLDSMPFVVKETDKTVVIDSPIHEVPIGKRSRKIALADALQNHQKDRIKIYENIH